MKVCHMSDTHDVYQDFSMLVEADTEIVFITGDMTYKGSDHELKQLLVQMRKLKTKVPHVVVIPGNHEVGCQKREKLWKYLFKRIGVHFLINESVTIDGVNIFGSPWTPWFFDWAYNYTNPRFGENGKTTTSAVDIWNQVSEDTHVLLTHGPPQFILDQCRDGSVGCPDLRRRIEALPNIKYNMFGHIHEGYGVTQVGGVAYSNASIMNGKYKFVNKPNYFEIDLDKLTKV